MHFPQQPPTEEYIKFWDKNEFYYLPYNSLPLFLERIKKKEEEGKTKTSKVTVIQIFVVYYLFKILYLINVNRTYNL